MISPAQCRAARAWLNWSQEDLSQEAKVAISTVRDFENETREPISNNTIALQQAFERAGIAFQSEAVGSNGLHYDGGRIKEPQTYLPVLKFLDDDPSGFLKTSDLIKALEAWFNPSGEDTEILANRSDTRFSQIVRNIVSHKDSPTNLIGRGHAEYDKRKRGLQITSEGRKWLYAEEEREKNAL